MLALAGMYSQGLRWSSLAVKVPLVGVFQMGLRTFASPWSPYLGGQDINLFG